LSIYHIPLALDVRWLWGIGFDSHLSLTPAGVSPLLVCYSCQAQAPRRSAWVRPGAVRCAKRCQEVFCRQIAPSDTGESAYNPPHHAVQERVGFDGVPQHITTGFRSFFERDFRPEDFAGCAFTLGRLPKCREVVRSDQPRRSLSHLVERGRAVGGDVPGAALPDGLP